MLDLSCCYAALPIWSMHLLLAPMFDVIIVLCLLTFFTAVYDMNIMVNCCHELRHLPTHSPLAYASLSHPVAMLLAIFMVC